MFGMCIITTLYVELHLTIPVRRRERREGREMEEEEEEEEEEEGKRVRGGRRRE